MKIRDVLLTWRARYVYNNLLNLDVFKYVLHLLFLMFYFIYFHICWWDNILLSKTKKNMIFLSVIIYWKKKLPR